MRVCDERDMEGRHNKDGMGRRRALRIAGSVECYTNIGRLERAPCCAIPSNL